MKFLIKFVYQASRMVWLLFKPLTVGVRLLLVRDNQVLMVEHVYEDSWYLPGGMVERGETLEQAVRREASEEVGAALHDLQLFGVYTNFKQGKSDHVVTFLSHDFDLNGQSDYEIEGYAFFPLDDLPEGMSSGSENRIRDFLEGKSATYGIW